MLSTNFPIELQRIPQWIGWKPEAVGGRTTKIPYCPTTGLRASTTDPQTWTTYDNACEALNGFDGLAGLGFVFKPPYVGVDLDKCRNAETGATQPWALEVIKMLDSYTELSPSKTGYHILLKGVLPAGGNRRGQVEVYTQSRYFTITGEHVPGTPTSINERDLTEFHRRFILNNAVATEVPKDESLSAVEWKLACDTAKRLGPSANIEDVTLEFFKNANLRDKWIKNKSYISRTISKAIQKVHPAVTAATATAVAFEEEPEVELIEDCLPEFPIVPGTIGDLADALCPSIPREFKVMAAVTIVGLVLSGRVSLEGESHLEPRFYTGMIALAGAGKTAAINEISQRITGDFILIPSVDSGPALVDTFSEISKQSPGRLAKVLLGPDELTDVFEKAKSSKDGRNSLGGEILRLFEKHKTGNRSRQHGVVDVDNAALSILGGATPDSYNQMWLGTGGAASGLQSRFTLVATDRKMPEKHAPYDRAEVSAIVLKLEEQILNAAPLIRMTDEAWSIFSQWWKSEPRDSRHFSRIPDIAKRFLIVLAVTNGIDLIEPWLVKIGIEFGNYQIALRERFNPIDAHSWTQGFENRVLSAYKKHGGMTDNALRRLLSPEKSPGGHGPFLQALKNLRSAGAVIETGRTQRAVQFGLPSQKLN
jgi:hypothetical protein